MINERKRKVADIALKLFVEKGIQQTSIQEIIEQANISKGTFYNYFSSKNDCVAEILEYLRHDASQQRIAVQFGKDAKGRDVFIEQIAILLRLNEERNLHALFEAILSSNEIELKKLVLRHRIIEVEWLSERLIEVMGEEIRDYAFEGTILFYGMLQHMRFTMRITNSTYSLHRLVDVILTYLELIILHMSRNQISILDHSAIDTLRNHMDKKKVTKAELQELAQQLLDQYEFNREQQDLFDAIMDELNQERMRKIVLQQLIGPFQQLFKETAIEAQVNTFTNLLWFYLKSI